jgi:hypothetical protein
MKFSIITCYHGDARGLAWTAKSLALQQDAKDFEWIVVHDAGVDLPALLGENAALATKVFAARKGYEIAALNEALAAANGDYLWMIEAGVCFADSRTLLNVSRELVHHLNPDCLYGAVRMDGKMVPPRLGAALLYGPATHLSGMLFKRQSLGDVRFDVNAAAPDYLFMLQFFEKAEKIDVVFRIFCDVPEKETYVQALQRKQAFTAVRRQFVHLNKWQDFMATLRQNLNLWSQYRLELVKRLVKAD